jgi:pimeloyl-ACP methyl ester carboxylesterase
VVGLSMGASWTLLLAACHPERVDGAVFIGPALPVRVLRGAPAGVSSFDVELEAYEGWDRFNRHAWRRDYDGFLDFFFGRCFTEPHSTKAIEDCVGWGHETDAETLIRTVDAPRLPDREAVAELVARVRCPTLVIHGTDDAVRPFDEGADLAAMLGGELLELRASGHIPPAREPVATNLAIRRFVETLPPAWGSIP